MGRKKTVRPVSEAEGVVMLGGRIPETLHKRVKHAAVDEGISIQEYLMRALTERLTARERKGLK